MVRFERQFSSTGVIQSRFFVTTIVELGVVRQDNPENEPVFVGFPGEEGDRTYFLRTRPASVFPTIFLTGL